MLKKELEQKVEELQSELRDANFELRNEQSKNRQLKTFIKNIRKSLINVGFNVSQEYDPSDDLENKFLSHKYLYLRFSNEQVSSNTPLFEFMLDFEKMLKNNGGQ